MDDSGPLVRFYIQYTMLIVFERDGEGRTTASESDIDVVLQVWVVWERNEIDHVAEA